MKKIKKAFYNFLFRIFAKKEIKKYSNKRLNEYYVELVKMVKHNNYGKLDKKQVFIAKDVARKELKRRGLQ